MEVLMRWVRLLVQIFDYLVKAAVEFKDTDAGRKEWQDILNAYEVAVQLDIDGNGSVGAAPAPQATNQTAQAARPAPETTNRSVFG